MTTNSNCPSRRSRLDSYNGVPGGIDAPRALFGRNSLGGTALAPDGARERTRNHVGKVTAARAPLDQQVFAELDARLPRADGPQRYRSAEQSPVGDAFQDLSKPCFRPADVLPSSRHLSNVLPIANVLGSHPFPKLVLRITEFS